ncbi:hypothetical protein SDC9_165454 [bioreactor metagenome]|uniref:Uncharacterized protein n=1 Tax=bioreactor metagenome TaxID=1076179 RepID=A0A645FW69_9ZZZZ
MAVHPAQRFIFLQSGGGNVFGSNAQCVTNPVVVGPDINDFSGIRSDFKIGSNLCVVG